MMSISPFQLNNMGTGIDDEEVIPRSEDTDGSQEAETASGKELMTTILAGKVDPPDSEINSSLIMMQLTHILNPASKSPVKQQQQKRKGTRSGNMSATGDVEFVQTEPTIPIDPFSKREIDFAVRNKKCHHVYDRLSLEEYLNQSRNPRCPYIGCANREVMTSASVEADSDANDVISRLKTPIDESHKVEDPSEISSAGRDSLTV